MNAMNSAQLGHPSNHFQEHGYAVLRSLVSQSLAQRLTEHLHSMAGHPEIDTGDHLVPGTPAIYGDPTLEQLLEKLIPRVQAETGIAVFPTYSYARIYKTGDKLPKHTDRPACEISMTLCLGYDAPDTWPIWLDGGLGPIAVRLMIGDAIIYRGIQMKHWREEFSGKYAAQVFLHYVDQNGPHKDWKFDKRAGLSTS